MPKVKRGGTNPINEVAELKDDQLMRFWIRRGVKGKRKSPFAFKKRCRFMDGKPLLIVAPAGKKVKGSLLRATRVGSKTIRGWMYKEDKYLIIETKEASASDANNKKIARYIYAALSKYKVRVPLKSIIVRNPNAPKANIPPSKQSSTSTKTASSSAKRSLPSVEDMSSDDELDKEVALLEREEEAWMSSTLEEKEETSIEED